MMKAIRGFALVSGVAASIAWGGSFSMEPWIIVLEPQKMKVSQLMTFKYLSTNQGKNGSAVQGPEERNSGNDPIPVELTIAEREITLDGKVIYPTTKGAEDFVLYPSQFILYPGDTKKVQVQWVGTTLPRREKAFGLIATQLPLAINKNLEKPKVGMAMTSVISRYEGILVVRPKAINPEVYVDSVYFRNDSAGTMMAVILNNKGTGMQNLKGMVLDLSPMDTQGKLQFMKKTQIRPEIGTEDLKKSIFAGYRRRIEFPWPKELPVGPIKGSVSFPPKQN